MPILSNPFPTAQPPPHLVNELVERVLSVGSWLSEVNLSTVKGQTASLSVHALAVALHGHLLDVWG